MVDPKKQRPAPSVRPPVPKPVAADKSGGLGPWIAVFGSIVVGVLVLGKCSVSDPSPASVQNVVAQNAISSAIGAQNTQGVQTVTALSKSDVQIGMAHLKQVARAEGLAGEMIYSQNCYDALSRHFTWSKLDQCGAFDAGAAQSLGDGVATGFDKEVAWFQSEAAAGRYLKATTAAGEAVDKADLRLNDLQTRVTAGHPAGFKGEQVTADLTASAETVPSEAKQ